MSRSSVSTRNTKQELLTAYDALMKELEQRDQQSAITANQISSNPATLGLATTETSLPKSEDIITRLGDVRVQLNKNLGEIVDQLMAESENLQRMKAQAQDLQKEIEQLSHIKIQASTLQNLIALKEEEDRALEKKAHDLREAWEAEQQRHQADEKEIAIENAKQHKREEEEYAYALKMKRQKDEDEYKQKRHQVELELEKREQVVAEQETTYKDLQKQVADLEKQLEIGIIQAQKETEERVTRELRTAHTLEMKGIEGERNVNKLTITNLEKTIRNQETEVTELKAQLLKATQQIKDIAVSVIEGQKPVQITGASGTNGQSNKGQD